MKHRIDHKRVGILGAMALAAACGGVHGGQGIQQPVNAMGTLQPKPNFFLRAAGFDQDPSSYLGRFIPDRDTSAEVDEAAAIATECSQHFTLKKVSAAGVRYTELFQASASASAGAGVTPVSVTVDGRSVQTVKVDYTQTEKWIAELEPKNAAAFRACCESSAGRCTGRFIGEFIAGTGSIFGMAGQAGGLDATGSLGSLSVSDSTGWKQGLEWNQPAFFAFRVTKVDIPVAAPPRDVCDTNWKDSVPESEKDLFFVGTSEWLPSEAKAKELAIFDARRQVVSYIGEQIKQGGIGSSQYSGTPGALQMTLQSEDAVSRASAALVQYVKDKCWKTDEEKGPANWQYRARVLARVPKDQLDTAAQAALKAAGGK